MLRWPNITEVNLIRGRTFFNPLTIQWKVDNYSDHSEYLGSTFYRDDGATIDPHQGGFRLHNSTCDITSFCIQLKLPEFFEGHVEVIVDFNEYVITKNTGFQPVRKTSPRVTRSKTIVERK